MTAAVLVVDDNAANMKLVSFLLSKKGYEVRTADSAGAALACLEAFRPALILLDLQMPGIDGLTLARRLKADPATREIIVVALTAYAMHGDEKRARDAGCDGYITKPIDTRTLPIMVAELLEKHAQR
ncbi:MAG: response regulator [Myxococcales bacterium]|nr:response regulator [Myxococcales bacterium]